MQTTARLVDFLRKLAVTRNRRILDFDEHQRHGGKVLWLSDLPENLDVATDAGPGDLVLPVDPVKSEPPPRLPEALDGWLVSERITDSATEPALRESGPVPVTVTVDGSSRVTTQIRSRQDAPEVTDAFRRWLPRWQSWAEQDQRLAPRRALHGELTALAESLSQQDDQFELVLASGLLCWHCPDGSRIRNHVLSTPAHVTVDPETGRVDLRFTPDAQTRLEDRELLDDIPQVHLSRVDTIRDDLRSEPPPPLGDEIKDLLEEWSDRAFEMPVRYAYDWRPQLRVTATPELSFAPALVLRRRGRASLIRYYDQMLDMLRGPDAVAPLGLAQLVTALEPDERMEWLEAQGGLSGDILGSDPLFPLPANAQQTEIMSRLRGNNGVVVQGPPGTGKTHTIANLISGLLAQGQRVLVTSQKAQALRVLRDKLPPEIADLCISMTDLGRGGSTELEASVKEISGRYADYSPEAQEDRIHSLRRLRAKQRQRVATLEDQIRSLREAETYQHDEVAPGYQGTLSAIATKLRDQKPQCGWMPAPLPATATDTPPISEAEAGELIHLLRTQTPRRAARTSQDLVDPVTLPPADQVGQMIATEAAAHGLARQSETDLSRALRACPAELADMLQGQANAAANALHLAGLPEDPRSWDPADWAVRAVDDGLADREAGVWQQVWQYAGFGVEAQQALAEAGLRAVVLPEAVNRPSGAATLLTATIALRNHLASGGRLRRVFKPPIQADAEPVLTEAHVDGVPPTTPELLDVVIAHLRARAACELAQRGWSLVEVTFSAGLPIERLTAQLADHAIRLQQVAQFLAAARLTKQRLLEANLRVPLGTTMEWHGFASTLDAVRRRVEADQATAALEALADHLRLRTGHGSVPPEMHDMVAAVRARDPDAYRQALDGLAQAHVELATQRRCDDLLGRLREAHPGLAARIAEGYADPAWDSRLGSWQDAWSWARARTFFDQQRQPDLEQRLEAELADATDRHLRLTAELAAAQAWRHCLSRMNAEQAQALRAYQLHMRNVGKGTGRYASRYRSRAREAMRGARDAVPAWVMPLDNVLETMPPVRDSFDVVIVDEASQAGLEALFLLWLAPRVIVVGDDRQCVPSAVSLGELQPIFDSLQSYLPELPGYLRDVFTPNSSLFDILHAGFGSVIRLREHFRCMPEIIGFSSRQFYADEPLVPLRQFGADRLPPLISRRVSGGFTEGTGTRFRNPVEAEALVSQIQACLRDPAYRDKTFGVVVLQGTGQIDLIRSLLAERIDPRLRETRKLRVGNAPDFQGDERDIMFLSMVVAETPRAMTSLPSQRALNVAASRAGDQMWLFHSVTLDQLSSMDLRRSLLSYVQNPPPALVIDELSDVTPDHPHPDFDSLFEQRVFLRIRERGYRVIPQHEVNGRRIDLVVVGASGRLAVECDGDAWHSEPHQVAADLERERELKRAGWKFWRVRGSEFFFDPDQALSTLWETLDQMDIRPASQDDDKDWRPVALPTEEEDAKPTEITKPGSTPSGPAKSSTPSQIREPATSAVTSPKAVIDSDQSSARIPPVRPGRPIMSYTRAELRDLIRWIQEEKTPRSRPDLLDEAVRLLSPAEKGPIVNARIMAAIDQVLVRPKRRAINRPESPRIPPQDKGITRDLENVDPAEPDRETDTSGEFHNAMVNIYDRALKETGYRATVFLSMVADRGGLETARHLLRTAKASDGFVELWKRGRLDLTVEALVLSPKFAPLFTEDELAAARLRLGRHRRKGPGRGL